MTAAELAALPEALARLFHDTYERLAPEYGYETRAETKIFDPDSPNGRLMIAVCQHVFHEYGQAVRKRDAEICLEAWRSAPNDRPEYRQNAISHGCIACAAAIEQEKLP